MSKYSNNRALLMVRTPFQAWLAEKVLTEEQQEIYDVLYFTQNNSEEDRFYFHKLEKKSIRSRYCWTPIRSFDILSHLEFYLKTKHWVNSISYDKVIFASINSIVINAHATSQKLCELVTFDDGLANIMPNGMYQKEAYSSRSKLYQKALGSTTLDTIKQRIQRHYTVYPEFDNIVGKRKLKYIKIWQDIQSKSSYEYPPMTYFIGQPLEEALSKEEIDKLRIKLNKIDIDYYVKHPREIRTLEIGAKMMNKNGLIAEEAILSHSNQRRIHLIGWFSSTLFNLSRVADRCTMLLVKNSPNTLQMAEMAKKAGCDVEYI